VSVLGMVGIGRNPNVRAEISEGSLEVNELSGRFCVRFELRGVVGESCENTENRGGFCRRWMLLFEMGRQHHGQRYRDKEVRLA
jgi:hypothetical protein